MAFGLVEGLSGGFENRFALKFFGYARLPSFCNQETKNILIGFLKNLSTSILRAKTCFLTQSFWFIRQINQKLVKNPANSSLRFLSSALSGD